MECKHVSQKDFLNTICSNVPMEFQYRVKLKPFKVPTQFWERVLIYGFSNQKRKREAQEEQAEKIIENGDHTIYKCYDKLVFKLIGGKQNDDV